MLFSEEPLKLWPLSLITDHPLELITAVVLIGSVIINATFEPEKQVTEEEAKEQLESEYKYDCTDTLSSWRISQDGHSGYSRITLAAAKGRHKELKLLVRAGVPVDEKDDEGGTALMNAAYNGQMEACAVMVSLGADVHMKHGDHPTGLTAEGIAKMESHGSVAHWLRKQGRQPWC